MVWRKTRGALCALVVTLGLAAGPVAAGAADLADSMAANLRTQGLQGAVWALIGPDGTQTGAAGLRNAATGVAMNADDRVQVGSVTKSLVATGMLRLVTEGRLSLDTPLASLLPDVRLDNPWEQTHPVRLRHLLDHTAGLDDARLWHIMSRRATPDTPLSAALAGTGDMLRVRVRPGSRFSYSNLGYHLAGMVIERVTGQDYEDWLDANLLAPLGMTDSTFTFVDQATDPRLAMGHFEAGALAPAIPMWLRTGVQFTTTAADMARFARFLLGDGQVDGRTLVRPDLLLAMGRATKTEAVEAGLLAGYSLGLDGRDRHGAPARCHSGSMVGYNAVLCIFPDLDKAFFLSVNADDEAADMARLETVLVGALDIAPATAPPSVAPDPGLADWLGTYAPAPARFETTAYLDRLTSTIKLSTTTESLVLAPFQAADRLLQPAGGLLFRAEARITPSHVLYVTADGERVVSTGLRSWQRVNPVGHALLWAGLAAGLAGLTWTLASGFVRLRRILRSPVEPILPPFLATLALLPPLLLLAISDFLAIGDPSIGSLWLATATLALPLAALAGLFMQYRAGFNGKRSWMDVAVFAAIFQWSATLAIFDLVPLTLWA